MRKKITIIGICTLAAVALIIAGAGLWIKANLQEIVQDLTGKNIRFASVDIRYAPLPAIILTDLDVQEGQNNVKVPKLTIYPELGNILSGQFSVSKAVLDDPLVVANGFLSQVDSEAGDAPPASLDTIADTTVVVNRGKLILREAHRDALNVSITAQAEKIDQSLSVQLGQASIEEIGLDFTGRVGIASFSPLKLSVNAKKGTFNPRAVKDFLLRFGYISAADADRIPAIERIASKDLKLVFDAGTGGIDFETESLNIDANELRDVAVKLAEGGKFSVECAQGKLDSKTLYGWLIESTDGKKMITQALEQAKLKAVAPDGTIQISALELKSSTVKEADGRSTSGPINGQMDINASGLQLLLTAANDQQQQFTISRLASKITIEKGRPTIQVKQIAFDSSRGGNGNISGQIPLPVNFKQIKLQSKIDGLRVFDTTLDLNWDNTKDTQSAFRVKLASPDLELGADGRIRYAISKKSDIDIRVSRLHIADNRPQPDTPPNQTPDPANKKDNPFNTQALTGHALTAKALINAFQFNGLPRLKNIDLRFLSDDKQATLHGTLSMGEINLALNAVAQSPDRIAATVETSSSDVDLTALIACFSSELPVYLSGRLYLSGQFAVNGTTPQELMERAQGEMTVLIHKGVVRQLSALDSRLGFILDMLKTAGIKTKNLNSIQISKGVIKGHFQTDRLVVDKFSFVGPLLSTWGAGEYTLKDKRLVLSYSVKTPLGVKKDKYNSDQTLEKEKT